MENLESFGVQQLSFDEVKNIQGGGIGRDWLIGKAIDLAVDFMFSDWDEYGAYAYKHQNSSGGAKW